MISVSGMAMKTDDLNKAASQFYRIPPDTGAQK
jgi:hypothetical protein